MNTNANTDVYDKVVDRAAMLRYYEARVNSKVAGIIDDHEVKSLKLFETATNQKKLQEALEKQSLAAFREIHNVTKRSLLDLFSDQASYAYQNIESVMGKIWRTQRPERRLAEEVVLERPLYNDATLSAGWAGVSVAERKRLEAVIRRGLAEGQSIPELAAEVRKGNVHTITRQQSFRHRPITQSIRPTKTP